MEQSSTDYCTELCQSVQVGLDRLYSVFDHFDIVEEFRKASDKRCKDFQTEEDGVRHVVPRKTGTKAAFQRFWKRVLYTVLCRAAPMCRHNMPGGSLCDHSSSFVESVPKCPSEVPIWYVLHPTSGCDMLHTNGAPVRVCVQVLIEVRFDLIWHALDHIGRWSAVARFHDRFDTGTV